MERFITAQHAFNAGDLLTILPGLKNLYEKNGTKIKLMQRLNLSADYGHANYHPVQFGGKHVCLNEYMFNMLKPLVEYQEYIGEFTIWQGEVVDFNYDLTRQHSQMPLPAGPIHFWPTLIYPQLLPKVDDAWINVPDNVSLPNNLIYLNFTERYRNDYIHYFFLKEHEFNLRFVGTEREHEQFCQQWKLNIPHFKPDDFLILAQALKKAKLFLGCQSMCWHLCDAMKVPRLLEVCSQYPNTFPTGKGGYAYITQGALEFYFKQLMNN
jgi:hypothetical protein